MDEIRLQKLLSRAGVASRRAAERLIAQGRVQVNGQTVTQMGVRVDPNHDRVTVDGQLVSFELSHRYILLYKPRDYLSVLHDDRGRPSLIDLLPTAEGLFPVGRLDLDSEGLLLLTDDGPLAHRLTHPRYEHDKEYHVLVRGRVDRRALNRLSRGVDLEEGRTAPAQVNRLPNAPWGEARPGEIWVQFVLHEGRKRQIRRMCRAVRWYVVRLVRVRIGPLTLDGLAPGESRHLTAAEQQMLISSIGRNQPE